MDGTDLDENGDATLRLQQVPSIAAVIQEPSADHLDQNVTAVNDELNPDLHPLGPRTLASRYKWRDIVRYGPYGKDHFLREVAERWAKCLRPREAIVKHGESAGNDPATFRRLYNNRVRDAIYLDSRETVQMYLAAAIYGSLILPIIIVSTLIIWDSWWHKITGIVAIFFVQYSINKFTSWIMKQHLRNLIRIIVQVTILSSASFAVIGIWLLDGDFSIASIVGQEQLPVTLKSILGCAALWTSVTMLVMAFLGIFSVWLIIEVIYRKFNRRSPNARIIVLLTSVLQDISNESGCISDHERQRLVNKLYLAAATIAKALPNATRLAHLEGRTVVREHYKRASAAMQLGAVWIALPSEDNLVRLRESLVKATYAVMRGMYHDLPTVEPSRESTVGRLRRFLRFLRTLTIGAIPIIFVLIANLAGISLDTALGDGFKVGAIVWAAVTYVSLLDPLLSKKVELAQGISGLLPGAK